MLGSYIVAPQPGRTVAIGYLLVQLQGLYCLVRGMVGRDEALHRKPVLQ